MQCTILSIRVIIWQQNSAVYTRGPQGGPEARGPNKQGPAKTTDLDPWAPAPPRGPPSLPSAIQLPNNDSYRHSNALNFLLLNGSVFLLLYLGSKVKKKVTLFCIISILVLLTHMSLGYIQQTSKQLPSAAQTYSSNVGQERF